MKEHSQAPPTLLERKVDAPTDRFVAESLVPVPQLPRTGFARGWRHPRLGTPAP
jgi:hypothetical protein